MRRFETHTEGSRSQSSASQRYSIRSKAVSRTVAGAIAALFSSALIGSAHAVEQLELRQLPGVGLGSEALGFTPTTGADRMEVVGGMTLPSGLRVPVHWRHDVATGESVRVELPIVAGATGVANAIEAVAVTDQCIAAGDVRPLDGFDQAIFWVEHEHEFHDGAVPEWFEGLMLPDFGSGSHANDLVLVSDETRADVVGDVTIPGSGVVPALWSIDWISGEIERTELPVPVGAEGTATSIARAGGGRLIVSGTLIRDGRSRAVRWDVDAGAAPEILSTPRGADSVAAAGGRLSCLPEIPVVSTGAICRDDACLATLWAPSGSSVNLHTNTDFIESRALSDAQCAGALVLAGKMTDEIGSVGTLFLPQAGLAADINRLLVNPEDGLATVVNAIDETGFMVGSGNACANPNVDCGIIFVPVGGRIVSQQLQMQSGSAGGGEVTATWQDDDVTLRLRPRGSGREPTIVALFEAQQIADANSIGWDALVLTGNGRTRDSSARFGVRVQLYDVTTQTWETVGQFEATTTKDEFVIPVLGGEAFVDARSRIRSRLQVRRIEGRGRWEFEIERFRHE